MDILSFNKVKQDELLQKSSHARSRRRYREAYEFLREALRYGEDSAILSRAAMLLNEMGEHGAALQVATFALTKDRDCDGAMWEMAVALERSWDLDEAIGIFLQLNEARFPRLNEWLCACFLKKGDLDEARKYLFRIPHDSDLPPVMNARCERMEKLDRSRLTLRDWKWVMHGHVLVHERGEQGYCFQSHRLPEGADPADFAGQHYVSAEPSFHDCARVLLGIGDILAGGAPPYTGIFGIGETGLPVALFLSRLLSVPKAGRSQLMSSDRLLIVLGSNTDPRRRRSHLLPQHDVLILMKSFEREEFCDVVAPPNQKLFLGRWGFSIGGKRRQIIGAIGELIVLPWERHPDVLRKPAPIGGAYEEKRWNRISLEKSMAPEAVADMLWTNYEQLKR